MKAVFVSYDGALDPLGGSQVVPYVVGLARRGVDMTLISFEKPEAWSRVSHRETLQARLASADVRWRPLVYHRRPRVSATVWDLVQGIRALRQEVRHADDTIIHCRGDVAMFMARHAGLTRSTPFLYDVRGLFSDERVESGSWPAGGALDRIVRRAETGNLSRADAVVVLTKRASAELSRRRAPPPPTRVIPTSADLDRFRPREPPSTPDYGLCYVGSLGTWYMTKEMVAFARRASTKVTGRVLFLTPQVDEARRAGADESWAEVRSVAPEQVPEWLRRARAAFFFIRPTPAKRASCPTKLGECLATGIPFVGNTGIGDLDELVLREPVGVLIDTFEDKAYDDAALRLAALLARAETSGICRRVAETEFSLHTAVGAYHELYVALTAKSS
jgi:glycosyltransferase involved in cell wall biosynthesis